VIGAGPDWASSGGGWAAVGAALLMAFAVVLSGRPSAHRRLRRIRLPGEFRRGAAMTSPGPRRRPAHASTVDAALAVDLLGAALQAGLAVEPALDVVEQAMPTSSAGQLIVAARTAARGGPPPPSSKGERGPADGLEATLVRALRRSGTSGARLAATLRLLADDARAEDASESLDRARRVGVLAVLPLGVCCLPAFMILTVLPLAIGLFGSLR
jgi:hypothetical protein